MPDIFGEETIPVNSESPEGHDEEAAVETENEEDIDIEQDVDTESENEEVDADNTDSEIDQDDQNEEHSEELLAGKYKTTEELVKAYQNLQREFTKSRQGGGDQQQPGGNQTSIVPQQGNPAGEQQPDYNTLFWEKFRDSPLETVQSLVSHIVDNRTAPIFEKERNSSLSANIQNVAKEYRQVGTEEGLRTLISKVGEIAKEFGNPELVNNPSPRILQMAAREAFGDTKAQAFQKGKEAGRGESEKARQEKQGNGAKGGARRQAAGEKTPDQEMKESILAAGRGGGIFG